MPIDDEPGGDTRAADDERRDQERRARFEARYKSGDLPWDDPLPPPEVIDVAGRIPCGRALDLGTGYGRTAIYLARAGWKVDAIDYVEAAVMEARRRAGRAGVGQRARFHCRDVTDISGLRGPFDLAVDVGCLHGLGPSALTAVRDGLQRLLRPGGMFLLFAHLPSAPTTGPVTITTGQEVEVPASAGATPTPALGKSFDRQRETHQGAAMHADDAADALCHTALDEVLLRAKFAGSFVLIKVKYGVTTAGHRQNVPSAWYWFQRHEV